MAKKLWIIVVVVVAAWLLYFIWPQNESLAPIEGPSAAVPVPGSDVPEAVVSPGAQAVVVYSDGGFSPQTVNIKTGETVVFRNESSGDFRPASAMHPTHKVYPGSDIAKCGTAEAGNIFDACRGIAPGGEWAFTFSKAGTWKYHDHLSSSRFGTIVVE